MSIRLFDINKKNVFKYGPPLENKFIQASTRNALYQSNVNNNIQDLINTNVRISIDSEVTNFVSNNISNIIQNTDIVNNIINETDIVNNLIENTEIVNNIVNKVDIPPDILINTIDLLSNTTDRIIIKENTQINGNLVFNNTSFNDLDSFTGYSILSDYPIYINNYINLNGYNLSVSGGDFFYNNQRLNGLFTIDSNYNGYTNQNVSINTDNVTDYDLNVNGTTNISGDLTLGGDINMGSIKRS
jgi:hypothetical protein